MQTDERYMLRCLQLARLGAGRVAPNPMVGAVLVHRDRIIGEGWHRAWGGPHAEVECIRSVRPEDRHLIPETTIYVSLEPCAHYGKTPPCADLIIRERIPEAVVGCRDPFSRVDGKGIEKLRQAGVKVTTGVLEADCRKLNRRFFTLHTGHRPYVVLKWAQTADARIASEGEERLLISNESANRLVHRWRSEEQAILVGTNTALFDDPELTTRLWPGKSPLRLVVDMNLRLPESLRLFHSPFPTVVFNRHRHTIEDFKQPGFEKGGVHYYALTEEVSPVPQILNALYHLGISSVLVEGGARLLQSFIGEGAWDEARVITNGVLFAGLGLPAPVLTGHRLVEQETLFGDTICRFENYKL